MVDGARTLAQSALGSVEKRDSRYRPLGKAVGPHREYSHPSTGQRTYDQTMIRVGILRVRSDDFGDVDHDAPVLADENVSHRGHALIIELRRGEPAPKLALESVNLDERRFLEVAIDLSRGHIEIKVQVKGQSNL